jgi:hypothetical protein
MCPRCLQLLSGCLGKRRAVGTPILDPGRDMEYWDTQFVHWVRLGELGNRL